jgi:large subunit ribosomal protein L22e
MPGLAKNALPKGKKKALSFVVDCSKPVEDEIMDIGAFEKFLAERIKVGGKAGAMVFRVACKLLDVKYHAKLLATMAGALGDSVKITRDKARITVTSEIQISKRYVGICSA